MTAREYIDEALSTYRNTEDIIIQQPSANGPGEDEIVDEVSDGAWVMAWVFIRREENTA